MCFTEQDRMKDAPYLTVQHKHRYLLTSKSCHVNWTEPEDKNGSSIKTWRKQLRVK